MWADWSINDGYTYTAPAGYYPDGASPYGALDMAGNVEEWVIRLQQGILKHAGIEKYPRFAHHGLRGGSWRDHIKSLRSSATSDLNVTSTNNSIGFRCAYP